jgi:hypothetical protein
MTEGRIILIAPGAGDGSVNLLGNLKWLQQLFLGDNIVDFWKRGFELQFENRIGARETIHDLLARLFWAVS